MRREARAENDLHKVQMFIMNLMEKTELKPIFLAWLKVCVSFTADRE